MKDLNALLKEKARADLRQRLKLARDKYLKALTYDGSHGELLVSKTIDGVKQEFSFSIAELLESIHKRAFTVLEERAISSTALDFLNSSEHIRKQVDMLNEMYGETE